MAEQQQDQEKTEPPTPRKREEARREGNVAKSQDFNAAVGLLVGMIMLKVMGVTFFVGMRLNVENTLSGHLSGHPVRLDGLEHVFGYLGTITLQVLAPILACLVVAAILSNVIQIGFILTGKPLTPSLSKLNPLKGLARMVDARSMMRLAMGLLKVFILSAASAIFIYLDQDRIVGLAKLDVLPMFIGASEVIFWLALKLAGVLIILALIDLAFQQWKHQKDLRMTKHEVKEEHKRMDGDPLIRQRRQRVQRQLAMQRMQAAVPRADVVVTNPTHYAVALRYDASTMTAPKVVAKGADYMAMRIRQLATAHGVPLIERKELARALYRSVAVDQQIPPEFYQAVAEILAYVYRLSQRKTA